MTDDTEMGAVRARIADRFGLGVADALWRAKDDGVILGRYYGSSKGRSSVRSLSALRNRYRGQRAFIIGNGPSLRRMDLAPLQDEYTFGLNRIYLMFEELGFETSFLCATAPAIFEQFADEMLQTRCEKFFNFRNARGLKHAGDRVHYYVSRRTHPHFALDPVPFGVYEGNTVAYVAMQLAFHMGFSDVILIGVDHRFKAEGKPSEMVVSSGEDPNHFDPNYFGAGVKWALPDLYRSETAYRMARHAYELHGRSIRDATVDGALTVFPKVEFSEALAERRAGVAPRR